MRGKVSCKNSVGTACSQAESNTWGWGKLTREVRAKVLKKKLRSSRLYLLKIGELLVRWPGEESVGGGERGLCCNPNPRGADKQACPPLEKLPVVFWGTRCTEVEHWLSIGKHNSKSLNFAVTDCCWKQWSKIQSSTKLKAFKGYGQWRNQETFSSTVWGAVSGALG